MNERIRSDARTILVVSVLACGLVGVSGQARAAIIYDNGAPDRMNSLISDTVNGQDYQLAEDFTFGGVDHRVTDIHWFGSYGYEAGASSANPDDFTIRIFDNAAGVPATNSFIEVSFGAAMRADTGDDDVFGIDIFEFSADIDAVTLAADTTYWLSITNDTAPNGGDPWSWATSDATSLTGNAAFRDAEGTLWDTEDQNWEMAFSLGGGKVPEPSAALVFGIGCLVVGGTTRRRPRR